MQSTTFAAEVDSSNGRMMRFGTDRQHAIGICDIIARWLILSSTGYPQLIHRHGDDDRSNFNDIRLSTKHSSQMLM
ncbi:hypothetical protein GFL88_20175 [Rhizobium leguminosarum bv. viciae]|uniref:hypothetical protein n=1 Tax=Rhizobium leguminosarum TaxID=384 RepID=UPI0014426757|nr:hypothetical protein [Rhizobium leguminosarum]NKK65802.1 hypothetical protein [Rhizobium leguminosarum bv. viciae]